MSQEAAALYIHAPMFDAMVAIQSRLYTVWRNGAQADCTDLTGRSAEPTRCAGFAMHITIRVHSIGGKSGWHLFVVSEAGGVALGDMPVHPSDIPVHPTL